MNQNTRTYLKKTVLSTARIIALGFLGIILFGSLILYLPISNKAGISYTDSLYMSTSAVCLTGLSTVPLHTAFTLFGQIFFLFLVQVGGLGFTTITSLIFILIKKRITYKERLLLQESLNQDQTKGIVRLTKNVALFTFVSELAGFIILAPYLCVKNGAVGLWQAIFTSISAFCNAGFDIFGTAQNPYPSLMQYNGSPLFILTVSGLIIVGGLGFSVVANMTVAARSKRKLSVNTKTVLTFTAILLTLGTAVTLIVEYNGSAFKGMSLGEKLLNSFFQSVTSRTAGFSTVNQDELSLPVKAMTMIFMFIGGAPASTAGGIKVTTVAVLMAIMVSGLKNRDDVTLFKRTVNRKTCIKAISGIIMGIIIVMLVSSAVMLIEKDGSVNDAGYYFMEDIMFETFSAFGTTGLSTGVTPYFSSASKYLFMATMFFGRVGMITVGLMIFSHGSKPPFRYPEESLMIG